MCQVLFLFRLRRHFVSFPTSCTVALSSSESEPRLEPSSLQTGFSEPEIRQTLSSEVRLACREIPSRWKTLAVPVFSCGFSAVQKDDLDHPISWPLLSLLSLPLSPTLFLRWPQASSPGAVFPSTIQPFPLKFSAPPASATPLSQTNAAGVRVVVAAGRPIRTAGRHRDNSQLYAFMRHPETQTGSAMFSPLPTSASAYESSSEVKALLLRVLFNNCLVFFGSFHHFWILYSSSSLFCVVSAPFVLLLAFCYCKLSKQC